MLLIAFFQMSFWSSRVEKIFQLLVVMIFYCVTECPEKIFCPAKFPLLTIAFWMSNSDYQLFKLVQMLIIDCEIYAEAIPILRMLVI